MGAVQTTNPPSFESVWALIKEVGENQKETDRIVKENAKKQMVKYAATQRAAEIST